MCPEENNVNNKLFDEVALTYHDPNHLMYKKMKIVLEHIRPARALIDVGCGIGEFIVRLRDHFQTVVGIDISPREIEFAKRRLAKYENVSLHCGELESFHFADEHFDVCLCLDVLEHVPAVFPLLQEVHRILRNHADLVVTVPNWYDILYAKVLNKNPLHVHTLPPWEWMAILKKAGFKIRLYRAVDFPLIHSDFLSKKIPILGMCILIVASK
jgi:ubiquinone/menaquinone biosynthesis C-methylase UbiE